MAKILPQKANMPLIRRVKTDPRSPDVVEVLDDSGNVIFRGEISRKNGKTYARMDSADGYEIRHVGGGTDKQTLTNPTGGK